MRRVCRDRRHCQRLVEWRVPEHCGSHGRGWDASTEHASLVPPDLFSPEGGSMRPTLNPNQFHPELRTLVLVSKFRYVPERGHVVTAWSNLPSSSPDFPQGPRRSSPVHCEARGRPRGRLHPSQAHGPDCARPGRHVLARGRQRRLVARLQRVRRRCSLPLIRPHPRSATAQSPSTSSKVRPFASCCPRRSIPSLPAIL